jgi:hypothetical protein
VKMDEDENEQHNNANTTQPTKRHRLWILGVLLVAGSCMLAIVHLSNGLHSQLLANRKMVRALKEQLLAEGEEREALLRDKDASMTKTSTLRTKSKLVTEELLDQQRKARRLQQELLLAREDVQILSKNCTLATQRLKSRYEVTLRALHDRVVTGEECRALLERNVQERAKLESSLQIMQDRAYNVSKQLKVTKQKLRDALVIASNQRDEIAKLKRELEIAQKSSSGSSSAAAESSNEDSLADDSADGEDGSNESGSSSSKSAWSSHVDKKSGRTYWYNALTKISQWGKPAEVE